MESEIQQGEYSELEETQKENSCDRILMQVHVTGRRGAHRHLGWPSPREESVPPPAGRRSHTHHQGPLQ